MENSKTKIIISLIANIVLAITVAVLIFVIVGINHDYKSELETLKKKFETEKESELWTSDFTQEWDMSGFTANLVITPKCEIISITFTLDFYNEKGQITRTLTDTKTDLKKNAPYSFVYYFKDSSERRVRFVMIEGKVNASTRPDIGSP